MLTNSETFNNFKQPKHMLNKHFEITCELLGGGAS